MTPEVAALRIQREISATEDGIDSALALVGTLITTLTTARIETGSPALTGHRAIVRASAGLTKLVDARQDVIRAHEDLRRIAETADTPMDCPPLSGDVGEMVTAAA